MSPKIKPFTQCARINRTERFVSVRPLSGYRIVQLENDGFVIYLAPDAGDEALGQALLEALARSRFISPRSKFLRSGEISAVHSQLAAGFHAALWL
jgi:CDI immunity protein